MKCIRISILFLMVFYSTIKPVVPYVDPQTGENLWGLVSREGTAIDYIIDQDIAITATVDNTFLLVQEISMEIAAITATLAIVVTDLGIITTTLNNTYTTVQEIAIDTDLLLADLSVITATLNNTYQEVVNCCPCTYFITPANVPITITNPGTYCVTSDINTTFTAIIIAGTGITLDLRGHTITSAGGDAIATGTASQIRITNGNVIAANGIGINSAALGTTSDITIEGINAEACNIGFYAELNDQQIQYLQCVARNCTGYGFYQFLFPGLVSLYDGCSAFNNGGHGFYILDGGSGQSTACTVSNCRSERNGGIGYKFFGPNGAVVSDSIALENSLAGFYLSLNNSGVLRCTSANNGTVTSASTGAGFYLASVADGGSVDTTIMSCIAINNGYSGFTDLNTTTTNPNRLFNNYAIRNRGTSAVNYDLAGGSSQSVVVTTTNLTTNNNLSWWINMDGGQ
jgi:hypothetical protein